MGFLHNPHGDEAVRISIGFTIAGNLVVLLRLYCRIFLVHLMGTEDWCITAGMLCSTAFTILVKFQADAGLGVHEWELTQEEILKPLKAFYASLIFYNMTFAFVKASFLFQYKRLFVEERTRRAIYIVGAIVLLFSIETVVVSVFMCVPIRKFWVPSLPGFCVDKRALWFTNSSLHIITDIAIIIIPMPELSRLNLPRGQKIALLLVFACGFFACATSIIRLHTLIQVSSGKDLTRPSPN
ncbi:integral membrane protein [Fusarium beomiforme]|uniref:Integral membrane protein n=1 Tax=Fusarium beomiforme TaxID=44412 RepID=A0A9P5DRB1_9HYPO|nr:integral membrane protein [Fusarium beomiforme]